jgi:membrane protein
VREFAEDGCPQLAAAIAYHALFSLLPLVLVLAGVFSLVVNVTGTRADIVDLIVRRLPLSAGGSEQLRALLEGATGSLSTLGLLGLLGVIYGSSGMMASIRAALNRAWDVRDARPFLRGKLVDLGLVAGVALLALISIALSLGARAFAAAMGAFAGNTGAQWVEWLAGVVVPLVLAFLASLLLYRFVPARRVRLRDAAAAALLAGIALMIGQSLFALYVRHFRDFNAIYGAAGAVMGFMLFVYLSALILLAGAELASELPRMRAEFTPPEGEAGSLPEQARRFIRGLGDARSHPRGAARAGRARPAARLKGTDAARAAAPTPSLDPPA